MASAKQLFLVSCCFMMTVLIFANMVSAADLLRQGRRGDEVRQVQVWLKSLGYFNQEPTGYFGKDTAKAVQNFQVDHALKVDGIVGIETKRLLQEKAERPRTYRVGESETVQDIANKFNISDEALATFNGIQTGEPLTTGQVLRIPSLPVSNTSRSRFAVELLAWDEARTLFSIRSVARVTDVETGLTFRVFRHGGHFHADSEPYSLEDTLVMSRLYGGRWSWRRRAIIVEIGGRRMAASMNGMPHGKYDIYTNNFPGHFCIHFYGSRLHKNGRIDPDHQNRIMEALGRYRTMD
jgi:hypothetical protein